jgi:hypothetical protein
MGLIGNFTGIRITSHAPARILLVRINSYQLVYVAAGGRPVTSVCGRATDSCGYRGDAWGLAVAGKRPCGTMRGRRLDEGEGRALEGRMRR